MNKECPFCGSKETFEEFRDLYGIKYHCRSCSTTIYKDIFEKLIITRKEEKA